MVERTRLVRTVEKLWSAVGVPVERLILEIIIMRETKTEPLLLREIHVDRARIFALIEGVQFGRKPVSVLSNESGGIRKSRDRP